MIWEWIERAKPNGKRVSVYEMHGPFGMGSNGQMSIDRRVIGADFVNIFGGSNCT